MKMASNLVESIAHLVMSVAHSRAEELQSLPVRGQRFSKLDLSGIKLLIINQT